MKQSITRLYALGTILILSTAAFSQGIATTRRTAPGTVTKPAGSKPATVETIHSEVKDALSVIEQNYVGGKTLDYNQVAKASIVRCCMPSAAFKLL